MKTTLVILFCFCILFAACKKDNKGAGSGILAITGTWELRANRAGNILPATYPPGNGHLISFSGTNYAIYESGVLQISGTYQQHPDGMGHDTLIFAATSFYDDFATLKNDTLILVPHFPDIATTLYVKTTNTPATN